MSLTKAELRWLVYALRNLQTRDEDEISNCVELTERIQFLLLHGVLVIELSPEKLCIMRYAIQEGRCRNIDEQLLREQLQDKLTR